MFHLSIRLFIKFTDTILRCNPQRYCLDCSQEESIVNWWCTNDFHIDSSKTIWNRSQRPIGRDRRIGSLVGTTLIYPHRQRAVKTIRRIIRREPADDIPRILWIESSVANRRMDHTIDATGRDSLKIRIEFTSLSPMLIRDLRESSSIGDRDITSELDERRWRWYRPPNSSWI